MRPIPCLDPDRPLTRSELKEQRLERWRERELTRPHVEELKAALRWALDQIDDDPDLDHQAALAGAWALMEGPG